MKQESGVRNQESGNTSQESEIRGQESKTEFWRNQLRKNACWLCLALIVPAAGCTKTDPDALASIGRKLADRTWLVSENLEPTWKQFSARVLLENRVRARLHWDKSLATASIEVHATENAVELKGSLSSQEQVRRAVELAESTHGVEKVVNSLQIDRQ